MGVKRNKEWMRDIKAAKELCYPKVVVEMIENESSPYKRTRILHNARIGLYGNR